MKDELKMSREEAEELKEWINTFDTFVGKLDPNGIMIFCNEAPLKAAGMKKEEAIGKYFPDTKWWSHSERERKKIIESLERAKMGVSTRVETSLRGKDGTPVPVIFNAQPVFDNKGNLKYITVEGKEVIEEIRLREELKKAKENLEKQVRERTAKLLESEEKYRSLIENSPDGFVVIQDGKFVLVNKAITKLVNCPEEEIIGRSITDFMPAWEKEKVIKKIKEFIEKGGTGIREYKIVTKDGEIKEIQISSSKITYGGRPALQTVVRDVTAHKRMEEALAAEKERLAVTLRSIGDGMIATDAKGRIVLMNRIAEKLTGWTQEKAIGRPFDDVFHIVNEKTHKRFGSPFDKVVKTDGITNIADDVILIAKNGAERLIANSGAPIWDKEGRVIGAVFVFRDITERKKLEQELIRADKLESIGILAGGIAHDFNNILTAILGNITLTKMYTKSEKIIERLREAERACLRGRDLTQQLLTFSKGGKPIKRIISIADLIKEAANFALSGSNVKCEFSIPDDLWLIEVDEGQISQVINNIIINADQAMPRGGIIKVSCKNVIVSKEGDLPLKQGRYVKISIKDQGIGIPKKYLSKIFDPFFTTKKKGSGLGLATAYSIIKRHGGHIFVESEVGVGTTFHIYLPVLKRKEKIIKGEIREEIKGSGRVLLMDDEDIVLEVVGEMLRTLGYKVGFAKDGNEAIKLYKRAKASGHPFDAVIMDLTIPGAMGGKEAIKKLIEIDPEVKAIVSSGYSTDPVMADFRKYGFCGVIAKPYEMKELGKILKKVIKD